MASWKTMLGLVLSAFGVSASFSSFVFFFYGNYLAAIWALISGILAAIDFHLLFLHWRNTLSNWHTPNTVSEMKILAIMGAVAGLAGTIWCLFMFFYYNLPVLPLSDSYPVASVWSFMTVKWGIGLFFTSHHLTEELRINYPDLVSENRGMSRSPGYYSRINTRSTQ